MNYRNKYDVLAFTFEKKLIYVSQIFAKSHVKIIVASRKNIFSNKLIIYVYDVFWKRKTLFIYC